MACVVIVSLLGHLSRPITCDEFASVSFTSISRGAI